MPITNSWSAAILKKQGFVKQNYTMLDKKYNIAEDYMLQCGETGR